MRYVLIALLLTGCTVEPWVVKNGEEFCKDRGGVYIYHIGLFSYVQCQNGDYK